MPARNALASEKKGDADEAQEWRHIEDAIKMMRGPASKLQREGRRARRRAEASSPFRWRAAHRACGHCRELILAPGRRAALWGRHRLGRDIVTVAVRWSGNMN